MALVVHFALMSRRISNPRAYDDAAALCTLQTAVVSALPLRAQALGQSGCSRAASSASAQRGFIIPELACAADRFAKSFERSSVCAVPWQRSKPRVY